MRCADARALASLALDGELDELGARQLPDHVASCSDCARAIEGMRLASELLRSAPRARFRCELGRGQLVRACSSGATGGRIWAGAAMTLAALVLATGALPGREGTAEPSPRAAVVTPLTLPIGQRSAMDDFVASSSSERG